MVYTSLHHSNITVTVISLSKRQTLCYSFRGREIRWWFDRHKSRYHIQSYVKSGEVNSAPLERMDQERAKLHEVLREYDQHDIFNCDETGLHLSFHIFILLFPFIWHVCYLHYSLILAVRTVEDVGVKSCRHQEIKKSHKNSSLLQCVGYWETETSAHPSLRDSAIP